MHKAIDTQRAISLAMLLWPGTSVSPTNVATFKWVCEQQPSALDGYIAMLEPCAESCHELMAMFAAELTRDEGGREPVLLMLMVAHGTMRYSLLAEPVLDDLPSLAVYVEQRFAKTEQPKLQGKALQQAMERAMHRAG